MIKYDYIARKEEYGWLIFDTVKHSTKKTDEAYLSELETKGYSVRKRELPLVAGGLSAPIKLFINVSNHCNLECFHCFSDSSPQHKEYMPLDIMKSIVKQASDMGVFLIIIGGGEPFMRKGIWEIIEYIRSFNIGVSLTTNGTIINDKIIKNIIKFDVRMNVSFDGAEETHDMVRKQKGVFKKTLNMVMRLKNEGIFPALRFTLMKLNIKDVSYMISLAESLNLQLKVRRAKPSDRAIDSNVIITEATKEYYEAITLMNKSDICNVEDVMNCSGGLKEPLLLSTSDCGAGTRVMFIEANGIVSPCTFLGNDFHSGSVYDKKLLEIWTLSETFKKMRNIPHNNECTSCHRKSSCHAECPAMRLHVGGKLDAQDPSCLKPYFEEYLPSLPSIKATNKHV